ncbi:MMPL family transporter [Streptomyces noursei]|uniref:MMPL family transporter n=1 Tax=Streptomyces noursei TaxID=1971 RepID=UPI00382A0857
MLKFQFDEQTYELPSGIIDSLVTAARQQADRGHLEVLPSAAMMELPEVVGVGEIIGLVVAAVVLLVALGSLVAAGLPLLVALTGVIVGVGGTFALSSVFEIHSLTAMLALMLGLTVGIDYALFIVNRQWRFILDDGLSAREAAARAIGTAGSTVVIALAGLLVVGITLLSTMALAAAATIAIAVLLALTLLPAALGLVKEDICSTRARNRARDHVGSPKGRGTRWGSGVARRGGPAFLATCLVTLALAVPAVDRELGLPCGASYHPDTAQRQNRQNYQEVNRAFGPGCNGPLMVVARSMDPGHPLAPQILAAVARDLKATKGTDSVSLAALNSTGSTAVFGRVPQDGPNDEGTKQLATAVRAKSRDMSAAHGVTLGITGGRGARQGRGVVATRLAGPDPARPRRRG